MFSFAKDCSRMSNVYFTMEASPVEGNINLPKSTTKLRIRLLYRLKSDLNMFKSVYQLQDSPLLQQILIPKSFPLSKASVNDEPFVYRGYVRCIFIWDQPDSDILHKHSTGQTKQRTRSNHSSHFSSRINAKCLNNPDRWTTWNRKVSCHNQSSAATHLLQIFATTSKTSGLRS